MGAAGIARNVSHASIKSSPLAVAVFALQRRRCSRLFLPPAAFRPTPAAMRLSAPAAERNRGPILDVLRRELPSSGVVLEIASGTGTHVVFFARGLPDLQFQPTDPSEESIASIAAWSRDEPSPNLLPPRRLDVLDDDWGILRADAIVCINMIHIAPWQATTALFRGAARVLAPPAPLVLYGPFKFSGAFLADSNALFDTSLRGRNEAWGVRDLDDVTRVAEEHGFLRKSIVDMPAQNHVVVFQRRGA